MQQGPGAHQQKRRFFRDSSLKRIFYYLISKPGLQISRNRLNVSSVKMAKISSELREKIRKNPGKKFRVLIVMDEECDPGELPISIEERWLGNILMADINGAIITQLDLHLCVRSIEEDGRVEAL